MSEQMKKFWKIFLESRIRFSALLLCFLLEPHFLSAIVEVILFFVVIWMADKIGLYDFVDGVSEKAISTALNWTLGIVLIIRFISFLKVIF